jgi:PAS domain S-box-containing protein
VSGEKRVNEPETAPASLFELARSGFELLREVKDYAIYMIDPHGIVLSWNEGAQAFKGYAAEEIIGQHFSRFFTTEDRAAGRPERLLSTARAEGRVEDQAWRLRKDGTRFWADVVITALHDQAGQIRGFVKVTRDLTERRRSDELLRQSEERLRLLIDGVKDYAIFMLDAQGVILSWNPGAQRIKGYGADEVIGRHFSMFYPPELKDINHPAHELQIARQVGRYEEEGLRVRKNGERFWANVVLTAVYEPGTSELRGFAKVTRDLTERRRAEEAMRSASEEIDRERSRTEEIRNALRARDEFISVAAHELRTPLTALMLKLQSAHALTVKHAAEGGAQIPKLVERLDGGLRQLSRLTGLIQRLLDVSSIVRGRLILRTEDASMSGLVRRIVDDFCDASAAAGCELEVTACGAANGRWDIDRIEQVITNLISNAIKYGAGKPIEIEVLERDERVTVRIADYGIGIDAADLKRIFERFERAVPVDNYSGLGLGLYISKSIVEAHGGLIKVTSMRGQGTTFTVDLPRRLESERPT